MKAEGPAAAVAAVAILLVGAGAGVLSLGAAASPAGRLGAVGACGVIFAVAAGVAARRKWALGASVFFALCWIWASVALTIQDQFSPALGAVWILWGVLVIVLSVQARGSGPNTLPPPEVRVDEGLHEEG